MLQSSDVIAFVPQQQDSRHHDLYLPQASAACQPTIHMCLVYAPAVPYETFLLQVSGFADVRKAWAVLEMSRLCCQQGCQPWLRDCVRAIEQAHRLHH
jgi:hypothetical protein